MDMEERQRSDQTARLVESLAAAQTRLRNVRSLCVGVWEAQVRLAAAAKGATRWPKPYGRSASNGRARGCAACHICTGTRARAVPHLYRDWGLLPATLHREGGLTRATSAPGLGYPVPHPHRADLGSPLRSESRSGSLP